jgi:hypothetical protein
MTPASGTLKTKEAVLPEPPLSFLPEAGTTAGRPVCIGEPGKASKRIYVDKPGFFLTISKFYQN